MTIQRSRIMENLISGAPRGGSSRLTFDVLQRGEVDVNASDLASQTADEKMPIDLKEAINAVAIAKLQARSTLLIRWPRRKIWRVPPITVSASKGIRRLARRLGAASAEDARLLTIRRKQKRRSTVTSHRGRR